MAFILQPDIVRYACTCGSLKPLSKIFFCRHCLKIRCGNCVCHEVDSNFCSNCLENIPSAEARLKKNRCIYCFDCPSCGHSLATRAASVSSPHPEDPSKVVTRKMYYLACAFCRWTTRDSKIPDKAVASGGWPEKENPHSSRVNILIEHYRWLAIRERQEKERKTYAPRRNYVTFTEKFGLTAVMARKRAGLPPLAPEIKEGPDSVTECVEAVASEEVEPLPSDIFDKPVDLMAVTTMSQRLSQPDHQPTQVVDLYPSHKHLFVKRSQRCRSCEHNVSKPEYNPASIKFKIQLAAYYHVPEIRVFTCEPLRPGVESHLILKLCNPTQYPTTLTFMPLEEARSPDEQFDSSPVRFRATGSVVLPACQVVLPQRDDAAEYDDSGENHSFQDDPKVVVWRKGNKAMIKLAVTPTDPNCDDVIVGFLMGYGYTNTMTSPEQKEKQKVPLQVSVYVDAGKLLGKN